MRARNRLADVKKLSCNVCQDYLEMVLKEGWQQQLYDIAKKEVEEGKYRDLYIETYKKIRGVGVENYTVKDLDITIIYQIVWYCKGIVNPSKKIKDAISLINLGRKSNAHTNENEEDDELYLIGLLNLSDLKYFVDLVDLDLGIDDEKRLNYKQKYYKKIAELKDTLDSERIELVYYNKEMDEDIERILGSENPGLEWLHYQELYLKKYWPINPDKYLEFLVRASDKGVKNADVPAVGYFVIKKNYEEVDKRLMRIFAQNDKSNISLMRECVGIINDYYRGKKEITKGMEDIINQLIQQGYPIEKKENGMYFWRKKTK